METHDCEEEGHLEVVSWCCGRGEHEHVEGMCSGGNEYSGSWFCVECEMEVPMTYC